MANVLIAIPCGNGTIKSQLLPVVLTLALQSGCATRLMVRDGCLVHDSRNEFVREARRAECDHIFMLDSDVMPEPGTLARLLSHGVDIVGASYNYRGLPLRSTVKMRDADGRVQSIANEDIPSKRFKCHSLGTGCLLIKTAVFDKLAAPWFNFEHDAEGVLTKTEDTFFCEAAAAAGFDIWCGPTVVAKHVGDYEY